MIRILLAAIILSAVSAFAASTEFLHTFKKVRATDQFWAEGAAIGDFNQDGKIPAQRQYPRSVNNRRARKNQSPINYLPPNPPPRDPTIPSHQQLSPAIRSHHFSRTKLLTTPPPAYAIGFTRGAGLGKRGVDEWKGHFISGTKLLAYHPKVGR